MFECLLPKKIKEDTCRKITRKHNKKYFEEFQKTTFSERVIFVPQCLRNIEKCKAKEKGSYYVCAQCGGCKIGVISKKSKELGYKALYVLKGGRVVEKLLSELKPKAVIGIACYYEGAMGIELCRKTKVLVQFSPLTKDGCVNTDLDLEETLKTIEAN